MSLEDTLAKAAQAAHAAFNDPTRSEDRAAFLDPHTPATKLLVAARRLYGPEASKFEMETFWLELDPPPVTRDKLSAAHALDTHPSLFWDARVFGSTCLAFCDESPVVDETPRPTPEQMAWGRFEAELIFSLQDHETDPDIDDEVISYVAHVLHDAGFVKAPVALEFADDKLVELLNPEAKELRTKVEDACRTDIKEASFDDDTAVGIQRARQASVHQYLLKRAEALLRSLGT